MSNFTDSAESKQIDQQEHNHDAGAKRVVVRAQDPDSGNFVNIAAVDNGDGTFGLSTAGGGGGGSATAKPTDAYGVQAISDDGTYKYFFFEDASANYYIMRKTTATSLFKYTKGTGGYSAVYVSSTAGPSGSPTWADYGTTF